MAAPDFFQPVLTGERVELRPLAPEDWDELYAVASDPLIWELHPANDRWQEPAFREYFDEGLASGGALAIVDRATGRIVGASRYYGHDAERDEVEIGWTFLARTCWGGSWNREVKRLMVNHILQFVGNAVFDVGEHNYRSQRAMEKIGGVLRDEVRWRDYRGKPVRQLIYEIREPMA